MGPILFSFCLLCVSVSLWFTFSQQRVDDAAVVDDLHRPALRGEELLLGVDAEQVADGRTQVFRPERFAAGALGTGVGLADGAAALDTAAAQRHGERRPPVVPAAVLVDP